MFRALVLFEEAPDPERYQQHIDDFGSKVACSALRHGGIFGSPFGEAKYRHYAEFEWTDRESFKAGVNSPEFAASGQDAMTMGVPFTVLFAEVEDV